MWAGGMGEVIEAKAMSTTAKHHISLGVFAHPAFKQTSFSLVYISSLKFLGDFYWLCAVRAAYFSNDCVRHLTPMLACVIRNIFYTSKDDTQTCASLRETNSIILFFFLWEVSLFHCITTNPTGFDGRVCVRYRLYERKTSLGWFWPLNPRGTNRG